MSAIAGIWHLDGLPNPERRLAQALAALEIYGSDREDHWVEGPCALGRRFRPVLPEDRFDDQPLASIDQRFRMVADVRLDNRNELAGSLGLTHSLHSTADSTLLLAAWTRWQDRCLEHLAGDFAFAVWDRLERGLFLVRDPAGARPLFYQSRPGEWFAFASMPKGLHALTGIPPQLDEEQIAVQLALIPAEPDRVLFLGLHRLPPGCSLTTTPATTRVSRYWHPQESRQIRLRSDGEYLEAFRERLEAAVRSRLRRVGGVGSHLSAGLDSSTVTATAAGLLALDGEKLTAYTAVPRPGTEGRPDQLTNEGPAAAQVAQQYPNVEHILLASPATTFLDILDRFIAACDEPPTNPTNMIWVEAIQRDAASRGLGVMLTGGAGNATISQRGTAALSEWYRQGKWFQLAQTVRSLHSHGHGSLLGLARETIVPALPRWIKRPLVGRRFSLAYSLIHPDAARRLGLVERAWDVFHPAVTGAKAWAAKLLSQIDYGAMNLAFASRHGVELRDPTHDQRLVEFCLGVPAEQLLRDGQPRSLVRRAMRGRLPESTLLRRERGVQSSDWYLGMAAIRPRMQDEVDLLTKSPMACRLLDLDRARQLIDNWPREGFSSQAVRASWHAALTRGLSMGRFILRYDPESGQQQAE